MPHPSAIFYPNEKPPRFANAASVAKHRREHCLQALRKAWDFIRGLLFHILQIQLHLDHFMPANRPIIRAFHYFNVDDLHIYWLRFCVENVEKK